MIILSGNGLEHAVLALAAMHVGIRTPARAGLFPARARLHDAARAVAHGAARARLRVRRGQVRAAAHPSRRRRGDRDGHSGRRHQLDELRRAAGKPETGAVDDTHAAITPDTVAKILYTSGSTGRPKGVINTQRMLCSNQAMILAVMPLLEDAPVLCDWLPWNHTFGSNHNFGIVLYNGGTLYIDDGKPMPGAFDTTVRNLREVASPRLQRPEGLRAARAAAAADDGLREHFFSQLKMLFCAAAALRQHVADDILDMAAGQGGRRIPLVTGLGSTETAPFALCAGDSDFSGGRIGVPAPGVELKLAPAGKHYEARARGPNVTPGYWRAPELTAAAFDDEGYYMMGTRSRSSILMNPGRDSRFRDGSRKTSSCPPGPGCGSGRCVSGSSPTSAISPPKSSSRVTSATRSPRWSSRR